MKDGVRCNVTRIALVCLTGDMIHAIMNYAKARAASRILTKVVGGNLGTILLVGWLGKKAWNSMQARKQTRYPH